MTSYAMYGIYIGLEQQTVGRPSATFLCDYRVELVRDRLVSLMDPASLTASASTSQSTGESLSTLLRETKAVCSATHPELRPKLERLQAVLDEHLDRSRREADARHALLAL